ncbi:MAG: RIP metalloprotease RseP [Roseburia sp.]|nr:RIP metalloprotease RseP [Roseburia sp.]
METLISLILFVVIFGIVVISHEFGHFLLARANGIHVVEFSVGMGPTLLGFHKGDTKYSLKLFPIGGACMFEGEDGLETKEGEAGPGAFPNANVWSRISTVLAGPLFNLFLAYIMAFIMVQLIWICDPIAQKVEPGSAAMEAGLQDGDRIVSLNGRSVYLYEEILYFNQLNKGKEFTVTYERQGQQFTTRVMPKYSEEQGRYLMGISNGDYYKIKGTDGFRYAWYEVRASLINTYKSLAALVTGGVSRKEVAGPVGIANAVGEIYEQTKESWQDVMVNMMNMILLLSVNLGILNLLPLPALDGGRLVFLLLEVVRGKPIPPEKEGLVHFIGLLFFMVLMVLVFFNDLANIFIK